MVIKIIPLEQGWDKEIKPHAIDRLIGLLESNFETNETSNLFTPGEFMRIYTTCYNMCTQRSPYNWSEELYLRHGTTIHEYLQYKVLPSIRSQHEISQLYELQKRWLNHKIMNKWMARFFMYLDRYYVSHHGFPTLSEAGLRSFKVIIFDNIKKNIVKTILNLIDNERNGQVIDKSLIKECIEIFVRMDPKLLTIYIDDFENDFIKKSHFFYHKKASLWLETDTASEYLFKAENCIKDEMDRINNYLNKQTEVKILKTLEIELLEKNQTFLLEKENSGVIYLLQNDKLDDLARLYRLFNRLPPSDSGGLLPISLLVRKHIQTLGHNIIEKRQKLIISNNNANIKDSDTNMFTFVDELLLLHEKYKAIIKTQFNSNALFQKAIKDAFVDFINVETGGKRKNAEILSLYLDKILRCGINENSSNKDIPSLSTNKSPTGIGLDEQVEQKLEEIIQLFSYLINKDLFADVYRNYLAKRLLNNKTLSDDSERLVISKLKLRCGAQFTSKMEGMLNDLAVGAEQVRNFNNYYKNNICGKSKISNLLNNDRPTHPMEFNVNVLTMGHWPTYKNLDTIKLPKEFSDHINIFRTYYDTKTSHRKLQWVYTHGTTTVRGHFNNNTTSYEFNVTTLQAILLTLFNENNNNEPLSFTLIKEKLNLSEDIIKKLLHSFVCGRHTILKKYINIDNNKKTISNQDSFIINDQFTSNMFKIKIPMPSLEESHNIKKIEDDRTAAIEASIVRIMKARKSLNHSNLITEVLNQLSFFRPDIKIIKRRIEALIEREYLKRDQMDTNIYLYMA